MGQKGGTVRQAVSILHRGKMGIQVPLSAGDLAEMLDYALEASHRRRAITESRQLLYIPAVSNSSPMQPSKHVSSQARPSQDLK